MQTPLSNFENFEASPTRTEVLYGSVPVNVTFKDSQAAPEVVQVRLLDIEDYPKLMAVLENEPAAIDLYCGKPAGWSKNLCTKSHHEIMTAAERVNGDFFDAWLHRKIAKAEKLMPGVTDRILQQALQTSSPSSASKRA